MEGDFECRADSCPACYFSRFASLWNFARPGSGGLKLADLPPAVQVTVKEQSQGGTLKNPSVGRNKNEKVYGAVIMTGAKRKEVVMNAEGKVVDVVQDFTINPMPAAVPKTFKEQVQGATIVNTSKETENGAVKYVIETDIQGRSRNISIDNAGKIIQIEEQVALDTYPPPRAAASSSKPARVKSLASRCSLLAATPPSTMPPSKSLESVPKFASRLMARCNPKKIRTWFLGGRSFGSSVATPNRGGPGRATLQGGIFGFNDMARWGLACQNIHELSSRRICV